MLYSGRRVPSRTTSTKRLTGLMWDLISKSPRTHFILVIMLTSDRCSRSGPPFYRSTLWIFHISWTRPWAVPSVVPFFRFIFSHCGRHNGARCKYFEPFRSNRFLIPLLFSCDKIDIFEVTWRFFFWWLFDFTEWIRQCLKSHFHEVKTRDIVQKPRPIITGTIKRTVRFYHRFTAKLK